MRSSPSAICRALGTRASSSTVKPGGSCNSCSRMSASVARVDVRTIISTTATQRVSGIGIPSTAMAGAQQRLKALETRKPSAGWLAASDAINAYVEDASGPIDLLPNVHPDKSIRDAAQACLLRWQDFFSSLGQNEALYHAAKQVRPRDAIDREALRLTLENFEDSGVALPPEKRQRAKQLADRITELGLQFNKNVREDGTQVAFTADELRGVPEGVWKAAKRDGE